MPEGQLLQGAIDTAAALQDILSGLSGLMPAIGPVGRLVISADLTETGCAAAYERLRAIMAGVPLSWCAIPGNHDSREAMRAFAATAPWMPDEGPINCREDLGDTTILGLDTLVEGAAHGALSGETLEWLRVTLVDLRHRPVLIFMHHPPFQTGISAMDAMGLKQHEQFETVLSEHDGPVQIACGHVHRMMIGQVANRQVPIAPERPMRSASNFSRMPGSGSFRISAAQSCMTLRPSGEHSLYPPETSPNRAPPTVAHCPSTCRASKRSSNPKASPAPAAAVCIASGKTSRSGWTSCPPSSAYRNGHRERQLVGTFGTETVSVPRARIENEEGKITEWRSKALPRYQRLTKKAEALIASVYLAGTNTRRVKRALYGLFRGPSARTWSAGRGAR